MTTKRLVALLRGINVGGRSKVPMPELKEALSALGLEDVATYIQSGNVVFASPGGSVKALGAHIERQIENAFGIEVAVMLRTPAELRRITDGAPFAVERNPKQVHVVFLDRKPTAAAIAKLDPERSAPDEFEVEGREIYLLLRDGAGRTKLTLDYFERRLGVRGTGRNWNTVVKLLELAGG